MVIPKNVFEPLLKEFYAHTKSIEIDENFSTVFLPHTMENYGSADKKIFYIGRDTNYWLKTKLLMQKMNDGKISDYFSETQQYIRSYGFLEYNNNRAYGFWTLAMRLHLKLKGVNDKVKIGRQLEEKYYPLLNDFGWGNTNAIEIPQSLIQQGSWESLNKNKYNHIKEHSRKFDKLIHIVQAYKPDLIFIFHWQAEEGDFLEGLDFERQKHPLVNNKFWSYKIGSTQVIWTVHPNSLRFVSNYNVDSLVNDITNFMRS